MRRRSKPVDLSVHLLPQDWAWFADRHYEKPAPPVPRQTGSLRRLAEQLLAPALVMAAGLLLLLVALVFPRGTAYQPIQQHQRQEQQVRQLQHDAEQQKGQPGPPGAPGCAAREICSIDTRGGVLYVHYGDGTTMKGTIVGGHG